MNRTSFLIGSVVLAVGASSGIAPASQTDPALTFLRMVNTLQADSRSAGYQSLPELVGSPAFDVLRPQIEMSTDGVFLADQRVTFVRSADGSAYQIAVVPKEGCGSAWFSSQLGLIYRGRPLGCP